MIQKSKRVTFDPNKRDKTLSERGLDFEDAALVFDGLTFTLLDDRFEYGEIRYLTYGLLRGRDVAIIWTEREDAAHIISMRHCHEKEARRYRSRLG